MKRNLQNWRKYLNSQIEEVTEDKKKKSADNKSTSKQNIVSSEKLLVNKKNLVTKNKDEILKNAIKTVQEVKNPPLVFPDVDPAEILLQKDKKNLEENIKQNYIKDIAKNDEVSGERKNKINLENIEETSDKDFINRQQLLKALIPPGNNLSEEFLIKRNQLIQDILNPALSISEVSLLLFTKEEKVKELIARKTLSTISIRGVRKILLSEILLYLEKQRKKYTS